MVGKASLAAFAASALLLVGGQAAYADAGLPFEKLVEVTVDSPAAVDAVVSKYDAAEYKRVEADGKITLNVFVTSEEEKALKGAGYTIGRTIEDSNTGPARMAAAPGDDRLRGAGQAGRREGPQQEQVRGPVGGHAAG